MKTNRRLKPEILRIQRPVTHGGSLAEQESYIGLLERTVATCLLFEDTFYEGANSIAKRIETLSAKVSADDLFGLTLHAKETLRLRHVPLFLCVQATKNFQGRGVGDLIARIITRPDDITELISLYWKDGKKPLSKQLKRGLALAFNKFDEYQLAKYDRDGAIKLRDALFLVHAKPPIEQRKGGDDFHNLTNLIIKDNYERSIVSRHKNALLTKLVEGRLAVPETWETLLSARVDKKTTWEYLLQIDKLPNLALLSNLRNMTNANVDRKLVLDALARMRVNNILPYKFISAWRHAPDYAQAIENAMLRATETLPKIDGSTLLIVDVSHSMEKPLAGKTGLTRMDAACGLAVHLVIVCKDVNIVTFSNEVKDVVVCKGLRLIDDIKNSQRHRNTYLRNTILNLKSKIHNYDRVIVITDEQSQDGIDDSGLEKQYLINVAPNQYNVDTQNKWKRINGFSTAVVDFITKEEENPLVWS